MKIKEKVKMEKNVIIKVYIFITFLLSVFMANINQKYTLENSNVIGASSTVINLSNTTIGWGIKRNNKHEQPDVGSKNRELLEKYSGICLGNDNEKIIYLTFDEGYEAGYTEQILNTLKENEVTATFFITAHYVNTASELVQRMIDEGHIVGNHTVNHKSMPSLNDEELESEVMKLHQTIYEKFGYEMKYLRPPKGEFSERTLQLCNNLGYQNVMWSFAYVDWNEDNQPEEEEAKKMIIDNLHNGEVMLLHGNSKTNANILDNIIKEIKSQGYEIKSLEEM